MIVGWILGFSHSSCQALFTPSAQNLAYKRAKFYTGNKHSIIYIGLSWNFQLLDHNLNPPGKSVSVENNYDYVPLNYIYYQVNGRN